MKKTFLNLMLVGTMATFTVACSEETVEPTNTSTNTQTGSAFSVTSENGKTALTGTTAQNYTFKADTKYLLKGFVYVKAGATLTIEPGTVIMGDKGSRGTLVIEQGAKIIAEGTAQKPIVFTSSQPKGDRKAGDWGGVIILGNAPTNLGASAKIEGGVDRTYGGTNPADNSGILKYVRIEFGGIAFQPDNEINGLTLGGVGNGTVIDYVQVSHCGDDSFEMFGGTVNAKHLIAYKNVDDMFDTDNGYSGKMQFLLGIADPNVADASGSNGFESDGDAQGSDATPKTAATFSNVSLFGPMATSTATGYNANFKRAMHIRRNSSISVHNSVFAGWPVGLLLDGSKSQANATANTLKIQNTWLAGMAAGKATTVEAGSTFNVNSWFTAVANNNHIEAEAANVGLSNAFNGTGADYKPAGGSALLSGASFSGLDGFFENVAYNGAFGSTDWTSGWANFDPQNTNY